MKLIHCMNCMAEMEENQMSCPVCGYRRDGQLQPAYALRRGSLLKGRYEIGNVMGRGGFGVIYVGFDLLFRIKVAVKEYFPMGAVSRDAASNRVCWNSSVENQEAGCESFLKEARKMARIDEIPEIVRVRDMFFANETAYIVMDFVEGETLKNKLRREGPMNVSDCIGLFLPVIAAMEKVHRREMIHQNIKPDNIMLQPDGKVRLLDLGAAKPSQMVVPMVVTNGFSPLEQYSGNGGIGPWTDIYATCATIYYCMTGKMLPHPVERIGREELPLTEAQRGRIPVCVLTVLQKGLALRPEERFQTMEELGKALTEANEMAHMRQIIYKELHI